VNPKVIDLNVAVADTQKMLKRLIGENVELVWNPADYPCLVKIDVSQLDQILANLCVNARDAIRDVGGITLETGRQTVDDAYCAVHVGAVPGEYVVLTVSDSGYGMDPETLNQIFEPFFTTKGIGEGTGLGLATVYGILKQNNGFANVYSEPGHGTTFRIHLPVAEGDASPLTEASSPLSAISLDGAVLLVEDEPTILRIARRILEDNGCTVLAASTPEEALEIARSHDGPIPLLITDVVMPGMNGWELKERLGVIKSGLRCLYMSGYPADVIAHHGNLHEGVTLLEKPFTTNDFMAGISKVLGS
jgi:CheY-like chemotaxis protein